MNPTDRDEIVSTIFAALRAQGFDKLAAYDAAEEFADAVEQHGIVALEIGGADEQAEETGT